jgi:hypothetical protein
MPTKTPKLITSNILQSEKKLQEQLPTSTDLPKWIKLIHASIWLLNATNSLNVTGCFLCVSLQRPLLATVPINASLVQQMNHSICAPSLPSVPLWEPPDSTQNPPPSHTCYVHSSTALTNFSLYCHTNVMITGHVASPPGLHFWCHNSLYSCINQTTPGPCILVAMVPQLTLYGEAEFSWLYAP